jgi:hypothetical protein
MCTCGVCDGALSAASARWSGAVQRLACSCRALAVRVAELGRRDGLTHQKSSPSHSIQFGETVVE